MFKNEMVKKVIIIAFCVLIGFAIAIPVLGSMNKDDGPSDGIKINTGFKSEYYQGELIDVTGGILDYTKEGKTTQVVITSDMISGFTSDTTGSRKLVVTYDGFTCTLSYTIKAPLTVQDNVVYKPYRLDDDFLEEGLHFIFRNNGNKMLFASTDSGVAAVDVSEVIYSDDGYWALVETNIVNGKLELTYGSSFEKCKITNITENGFTWQYIVNESTGETNSRGDFVVLDSLVDEVSASVSDNQTYVSDRVMPSGAYELADELLYIKFTDNNEKVMFGKMSGGLLTYPIDSESHVGKSFKNGKQIFNFGYYNEYNEVLVIRVENITENGFTVTIVDLGFTFNMTKLK